MRKLEQHKPGFGLSALYHSIFKMPILKTFNPLKMWFFKYCFCSKSNHRWVALLFLAFLFVPQLSFSQIDFDRYLPVDERLIVETKWRYTYALHVESNTIIHKADQDYDFFLHFKYDYSYQQYLNGAHSKGGWSINERTLFYQFKHIQKFEITEINKNVLILEFTQANSKGHYQYHFVRVETKDAPFVKPPNELPDVNVHAKDPRT